MSKIIEETVNTVINEETVEAAVKAVEAIPVKSINWAKVGKLGAAGAAIVLIGVGATAVVKRVKRKNQAETDEQAADSGTDNVKVAEADFVEKETETE